MYDDSYNEMREKYIQELPVRTDYSLSVFGFEPSMHNFVHFRTKNDCSCAGYISSEEWIDEGMDGKYMEYQVYIWFNDESSKNKFKDDCERIHLITGDFIMDPMELFRVIERSHRKDLVDVISFKHDT